MRTCSVSLAADRLSVGQPAMSHSLRRLREVFGDDLLQREGGGLRPTDTGLALWAPVRGALEGLETGLDMARRFDPAEAERVFRLSMPDYLAARVMPRLLKSAQRWPVLQFRVESLDREPGFAALTEGRLDAFIGVMPEADWIEEAPLFEDDFVTLYDKAHWPTAPDRLDDFCAATHLLVSQADSLSGWVDVALKDLGRSRRVAASFARFGDAVACITGTPHLLTLPRRAARSPGPGDALGLCQPAVGPRRFAVNLYRRSRSVGAPASQWLETQIRDALV